MTVPLHSMPPIGEIPPPDPNPFRQIVNILISHHNHMKKVIDSTCAGRMAHRLQREKCAWHTYILADAIGKVADEIASAYFIYATSNPAPETWQRFQEASSLGRALCAKAAIPFKDIDEVFSELAIRHDRVQRVWVLAPSVKIEGKFIGPLRLGQVWLDESLACSPLFERLGAFAIQVQALGLMPGESTSKEQIDEPANDTGVTPLPLHSHLPI
jgi:hypothetical protein